jgi:hypothetical protein
VSSSPASLARWLSGNRMTAASISSKLMFKGYSKRSAASFRFFTERETGPRTENTTSQRTAAPSVSSVSSCPSFGFPSHRENAPERRSPTRQVSQPPRQILAGSEIGAPSAVSGRGRCQTASRWPQHTFPLVALRWVPQCLPPWPTA